MCSAVNNDTSKDVPAKAECWNQTKNVNFTDKKLKSLMKISCSTLLNAVRRHNMQEFSFTHFCYRLIKSDSVEN